eukprot:3303704-Rhodomonas_salina.2
MPHISLTNAYAKSERIREVRTHTRCQYRTEINAYAMSVPHRDHRIRYARTAHRDVISHTPWHYRTPRSRVSIGT